MKDGTVAEAEDAAMSAFADLYKHWETVDNPHAYVRTAAWHAFIKPREHRRKYSAELPDDETDLPESMIMPDPALQDVDDYAWVEWVIKDLPDKQQAVMRGIVAGLSNEQIALFLGTNCANVRSHLRHVRNRLKDRLDTLPATTRSLATTTALAPRKGENA